MRIIQLYKCCGLFESSLGQAEEAHWEVQVQTGLPVWEPCRPLLLLLLLCMEQLMGSLEGRGAELKVTLIKAPGFLV